jgi:hypothetical protein
MNGHALHLIFPSLPSPYYKKQNISKDAAWEALEYTYEGEGDCYNRRYWDGQKKSELETT